jgi:uncharacterized protein involved in outer membrane biogenesis
MRKLIRVLVGLAVVFVLVVVAVRVFLPADKIQGFLFKELESRTGLHAEAEKASIQFPWPVGLRLEGLKITSPGGTKGGIPRLQGEVKEALARADLMSLLHKKPQVQEIRLASPRLEVWMPQPRTAKLPSDGNAPGAASKSGSKSSSGSAATALALGLLSIDDGRLVVHQADASTVTLEGLNQKAHFQLDETGRFAGRLDSKIESLVLADAKQKSTQRLDRLSAILTVAGTTEPLDLRAQIDKLSAAGLSVKGPFEYRQGTRQPWVDTELQWEMDPAEVRSRLKAAAGASMKDWDFSTETLRGSLRAKGELPVPSAGPSAWLDLVQLSGKADGVKIAALGREDLVSGSLSFVQHGDEITLDPLQIALPGATLSGRMSAPALGKGRVNGELKLKRADLAKLKDLIASVWNQFPDSLIAGSTPPGEWPGISGGLSGTIALKLPLPLPEKLPASAVQGEFALGRIAVAVESLRDSLVIGGGNVSATSQSAQLAKIALSSSGLEGEVEGSLDGWPQEYRFTGSANFALVDLDQLMKENGEKHAQAAGKWWSVDTAYAQQPAQELPAPPEKLKMKVQLSAKKFRSRGYDVENLTGNLDLHSRVMKLRDLEGSMGGGKLLGQGSVDWNTKPSSWKGQVEAQQVSATSCLSPFAPKLAQAFQSSFSGLIQLNGPLTSDRKVILQALSGGGALKGSAGEFLAGTLLGEELSKLPGKMAEKLRDIPFKEFLAQVRFEAGKAHFDQAILKGPTQLKADGWAGFDGSVDYQLELKLPPGENLDLGSLTPLTEFLREKDGRITIPFHVSGRGSKPKVTPELEAAEKRAKDAVNQNLGNKLQDLLNGLKRKKGGG